MERCRIFGHGGKQMSHQVQINYKAVAIKCESICEVIKSQVKVLDEEIAQLERQSLSLQNEHTKGLAEAINRERNDFIQRVEALLEKADKMAKQGLVTSDQNGVYSADNILQQAQELQQQVNIMSANRIIEMRGLLNSLLEKNLQKNYEILGSAERATTPNKQTQHLLDSIGDEIIRQYTYLAHLQNPSLTDEALLAAGKSLMGQTFESRLESEKQKIRAELEAARVERSAIEKVMNGGDGSPEEQLTAIRTAASDEIVGEKIRQKSLKIIMQAIQARGFVVDKKNIKIKRDTNEVVLVALKASGEKAEFRVFLDGKFIYDFRGYEGQACQKDIEPFMHDLEEVYGVKVTSQQTIWSNPDKISTMKYQSINTNKNKR